MEGFMDGCERMGLNTDCFVPRNDVANKMGGAHNLIEEMNIRK
jgi:hypothetical protein